MPITMMVNPPGRDAGQPSDRDLGDCCYHYVVILGEWIYIETILVFEFEYDYYVYSM